MMNQQTQQNFFIVFQEFEAFSQQLIGRETGGQHGSIIIYIYFNTAIGFSNAQFPDVASDNLIFQMVYTSYVQICFTWVDPGHQEADCPAMEVD